MSGPRRLWIRFRRVDDERRSAYHEAVGSAAVAAGQLDAHFWGFEVDGEADGREGIFVEFLEGPSDAELVRLDEHVSPSLSAAGGAIREEVVLGADVLRCTELRDSSGDGSASPADEVRHVAGCGDRLERK